MVQLDRLFSRFPSLTVEQEQEIARRRIVRFIRSVRSPLGEKYDIDWALGYSGLARHMSDKRREGQWR